ncbi:amino acid adenylation domain-containing protein [Paenibacillus sp. S-38]|uniref:amino acid adenylation domain-containing protein n=1 Tax=Paenibacillus sp. S-38 TaxID=3416710 RepID=UPI003CE7C49C
MSLFDQEAAYWNQKLDGGDRIVCLPYNRTSGNQDSQFHTVNLTLEAALSKRMMQIAGGSPLALYMILLCGVEGLLHHYTNESNLLLGVPVFRQPDDSAESLNSLVIVKNTVTDQSTLKTLFSGIKTAVSEAMEHQNIPFWNYTERITTRSASEGKPLIHTIAGFKPLHTMEFREQAAFDLLFFFDQGDQQVVLDLTYNEQRYSREAMLRLAAHLQGMLCALVSAPDLALGDTVLITEEEKSRILSEFNDTAAGYPGGKTIHRLFEEQVERTPDSAAVLCGDERLTYRELNERANRLARRLQADGVRAGELVGIMTERSLEMVIGVYAILKAGGAYVPIDPDHPQERIRYVAEDSGIGLLLTTARDSDRVNFEGRCLLIDDASCSIGDGGNLEPSSGPRDLAYVMYTSGSTGNPKGVMIEHHSVVNRILWGQSQYPLGSGDVSLLKTAFTFDVSVPELFWWGMAGSTVSLLPPGGEKDPGQLVEAIASSGVTTVHFVPSMLQLFLEYVELLPPGEVSVKLSSLRYVFASGEALTPHQVSRFQRLIGSVRGAAMINLYGPTEATVEVACFPCEQDRPYPLIPIGKPIANTELYIVKEGTAKLQPIGVAGELCIAGVCLARGYWRRPELTAEKFVDNPFREGEQMYRTGDLARWLPDGSIEYMGRIDHQVKIRGYRIELGEIEAQLLRLEGVREAVVVAGEDETGDKHLCAYVVVKATHAARDWREELSRKLPAYMVPAYMVQLEKLPLTSSGKLDRRALPKPEKVVQSTTEYAAPRTPTEERLAAIWREVLQLPDIGVKHNFFELGGHSLWAARLAGKIYKEMNVVLPLREMFRSPTIESMAQAIDGMKRTDYVGIERAEERENYPVSSAQKRIYLLSQLDGGELSYNMPGALEIRGPLDRTRAYEAFRSLIRRHESLRTRFEMKDGEIVQRIEEEVPFELETIRLDGREAAEAIRGFIRAFDLDQAPLLRAGLVELGPDHHLLLFDTHHLISDGVSMNNLTHEFARLYEGEALATLSLQYKDYAVWQQEKTDSGRIREQQAYWLDVFSGELPVLELPADYARPLVRSYQGASLSFTLGEARSEALAQLARHTGTTLHMVLLAAYTAWLGKYSGKADVIVGTPVAGRLQAELEPLIGMFVGTLALRQYPAGDKSFESYLQEVKEGLLGAYEHQEFPFERLVEQLDLPRDLSRNPLFDTMFVLHNTGPAPMAIDGLQVSPYAHDFAAAKFDLTMNAEETEEGLRFWIEYASALFQRETVERMAGHWIRLIDMLLEDPGRTLSSLELMTSGERRQLLEEFNDTEADYPAEKTIHGLFEEQAARTPDRVAVLFEGRAWTYAQLNARANQVAHTLRNYGVGPDAVVAIRTDRSFEMMAGIFGILKAGGAYLPIDPAYPAERVRYMLEDSRTGVLLTEGADEITATTGFTGTVLDLRDEEIANRPADNPVPVSGPGDLAYVIYTSGSTGRPKGVMIEHHSVINRIHWMQKSYRLGGEDVILQKTPISFDVSVWELFWWSWYGASVCLLTPGGEKDPTLIRETVSNYGVTTMHFVPSMLGAFLEDLEAAEGASAQTASLKQVFASGEALPSPMVERFFAWFGEDRVKLVNLYGPTEATVDVSSYECAPGLGRIPIGAPIDNTRLYVVDGKLNLLPIGTPGELCIAGAGLARGYVGQPELTAEKFVDDPFTPGERMYRTGDVARRLPDGQVEYLGRMDHQVKIRGYRIELGEIERALMHHPDVAEAVVVDRMDRSGSGAKSLCAYVVSRRELSAAECREHLAKSLPVYMVPSYFVELERMPLTPNGKLDRRALPAPDMESDGTGTFTAPALGREEQLAHLWSGILGKEKVGATDDFFLSGGDSITLLRLASRIQRELEIPVQLKDLYTHRTIREYARYLDEAGTKRQSEELESGLRLIEAFQETLRGTAAFQTYASQELEDFYPLSKIQQSMVYYSLMKPDQPIYHDQFFFAVRLSPMSSEIFLKTVRRLMVRHAVLRTVVDTVNFKEPVQLVYKQIEPDAVLEDIRHLSVDAQKVHIEACRGADLRDKYVQDRGLLWRLRLFRLGDEETVILLSFHHAALDGWSVAVFQQEFMELYAELAAGSGSVPSERAPLRSSYKQYVALNAFRQADEMTGEWWREFLKGYTRGKLPFNIARKPMAGTASSAIIKRALSPLLASRLEAAARTYGITLRDLCLSAHLYLLRIVTAEEDIVTGVVSHDRPAVEDGDRILGCFLNTVPMRLQVGKQEDKKGLLRRVADTVYRMKSEEVFLGDIARMIGERSDPSLNPIFDTLFNYTDFHILDYGKEGSGIRPEQAGGLELHNAEMTNTLLDVEVHRAGSRMSVQIKYAPNYFYERDMELVFALYVRILEELCSGDRSALDSRTFLPDEARAALREWNAPVYELAAACTEGKTLHRLFEEQAARTPDHAAVRHGGRTLTYARLEAEANRLARHLARQGVRSGDHVALVAGRGAGMITGMLAILKAGAAYVPVDPEYPPGRKAYILQNAEAAAVLADRAYPDLTHERVILMHDEGIAGESPEPLMLAKDSGELAYIIYTSGSTGTPKGVMIEHRSAVNLVSWVNRRFAVGGEDRLLFITSMCFDLSVYDIFGMLAAGGTVVVAEREEVLDPGALLRLMEAEEVTFWDSVPTTMNHFIHHLEEGPAAASLPAGLRLVFMSGDWIPVTLPGRIRQLFPQAEVISLGGATEATVWSNYYPVLEVSADRSSVPYGRPIGGNAFYILDDDREPVPWGVVGELYIGGVGVARGYMNDEAKTSAAFLPDPFLPGGGRMYKTGDLGRLLPDGNMEFLGRKDHQVKIRGYRVELGEIDSRLARHPGIREAVVMDRLDGREQRYLCAYIVPSGGLTVAAVREYLAAELPSYMVPGAYVFLDGLPLNANGKVDRKALPEPALGQAHPSEAEAPADATEQGLADLWEDTLGQGSIGVNESFFERGGDSLSVTRLTARIRNHFKVEVPLQEVFQSPTVRELAKLIRAKEAEAAGQPAGLSLISKAPEREVYPLSSAQKRIYLVSTLEGGEMSYNTPVVLQLDGPLDPSRVQEAFRRLIARHETLRTGFEMKNGEMIQRIREETAFDVETVRLNEEEAPAYIQGFMRPFNLKQAPLMRAGLVELEPQRHLLLFDIHHIVSDGISMINLAYEFTRLYEGETLQPLALQYKDYAVWQQREAASERLMKQEAYWLEVFRGELPVLELPADYARPPVRSYEGAAVRFTLGGDRSEALRQLASRTGTTLYMVLLAAYTAWLGKYTGSGEIVVGTPVASRLQEELEPLVGMFVGTLALRQYPAADKTFEAYLEEVKIGLLQAYEHQEYPFEELVERLALPRDLSRNPLFDTMFIMNNMGHQELAIEGVRLSPYPQEFVAAKFDLTLNVEESAEGLRFTLEYATALFKRETAERMAGHWLRVIDLLLEDPQRTLSSLELITEVERRRLLEQFNCTAADYDREKTVHEQFEEQAKRTPESLAVVCGGERLTYRELNARANRLAHLLRGRGVQPDQIVGLLMERSVNMPAAMLAVLKAGGAYCPIDPAFPEERIEAILEDSEVRLVVASAPVRELVPGDIEVCDMAGAGLQQDDAGNPAQINHSGHLAYVIYTSGSTGKPKGVMLEHRSVHNLIQGMKRQIGFYEGQRVLAVTTYGFDIFVLECLLTLTAGGVVVLATEEEQNEPQRLLQLMEKERVELMQTTPSRMGLLLGAGRGRGWAGVKQILLGGEAMPAGLPEQIRSHTQAKLYNLYGPTETTVWSTMTELSESGREVGIGKPIMNTQVYIVDPSGVQLRPVGVTGELCIAGDGLARGYWRRPELTAEKFVENPFLPGERMYRTGDLAKWLPDGSIAYAGRIDHQVKIRGYRIEPGEIEAQLAALEGIREAVVMARPDPSGQNQLCAYYTGELAYSAGEIRTALSRMLPSYMLPAYVVRLESMPLNANGKVDRRALPLPDLGVSMLEYQAPESPIEIRVAAIWQELLGISKVGMLDHLADMGVNSLSYMRAIVAMEEEFDFEFPDEDMIPGKFMTIADVADYVEGRISVTPGTK